MQFTEMSIWLFSGLAILTAGVLAVLQYLRIRPRQVRVITTLFWQQAWSAAVRQEDWKLIRTPADVYWLFDLARDPGERVDLATEHTGKVAELRVTLETWEQHLPAPMWAAGTPLRARAAARYGQPSLDLPEVRDRTPD